MLLQSIAGYEYILGLGLMFGLAFMCTLLTYRTLVSFLVFIVIFNGFVVWAGLLEAWTLILTIILMVVFVYFNSRREVS